MYSYEAAKVFSAANIPTTFICDAGIGASIEKCNMVLVGAEGVMESGGIVNKVRIPSFIHCNYFSFMIRYAHNFICGFNLVGDISGGDLCQGGE